MCRLACKYVYHLCLDWDCLGPVVSSVLLSGLEEALVASLADAETDAALAGAPPASKHVVKSLVRETLTDSRLEQLGGAETQCAVCRYVML